MKYLIVINAWIYLLISVFIPYKIVKIQELSDYLPMIMGVGLVVQAISGSLAGKLVDISRKYSYLGGTILQALVVISYYWVDSLWQIIVLQFFYFLGISVAVIAEKVLIVNYSQKAALGAKFGVYDSVMAGVGGVALIFGNFLLPQGDYLFLVLGALLLVPNFFIYKYIN